MRVGANQGYPIVKKGFSLTGVGRRGLTNHVNFYVGYLSLLPPYAMHAAVPGWVFPAAERLLNMYVRG